MLTIFLKCLHNSEKSSNFAPDYKLGVEGVCFSGENS